MTSRFKPGNLFRELEDINGFENIAAGKTYGLRQKVFGGPLEASDTSLSLTVDPSGGLDILAGGVGIKPYSSGGLQTSSNGASIKIDPNGGLSTGVGGLKTLHPEDSGLQTDTSGIKIKKDTTKPGNLINVSTSGLSAETKISYIQAFLEDSVPLNVSNSKIIISYISSYGESIGALSKTGDEIIIQKSGRYKIDYFLSYGGDENISSDGYLIGFRLNRDDSEVLRYSDIITIKNSERGSIGGFYFGPLSLNDKVHFSMVVAGNLAPPPPAPTETVDILGEAYASSFVLTYLGS